MRAKGATFGVCYNGDDDGNFDYLAGVEVSAFSDLPAEFARSPIPAQRYGIFTHREHVSTMRDVSMAIWTKWLPESGFEAVDAPYLEYYGEEFDGRTGMGPNPDTDQDMTLIYALDAKRPQPGFVAAAVSIVSQQRRSGISNHGTSGPTNGSCELTGHKTGNLSPAPAIFPYNLDGIITELMR